MRCWPSMKGVKRSSGHSRGCWQLPLGGAGFSSCQLTPERSSPRSHPGEELEKAAFFPRTVDRTAPSPRPPPPPGHSARHHPPPQLDGARPRVVVELPGALPGAPSGAAQARRLEPRPCPRSGKARKTPGFQLFVRLSLLLECWKGEGVDVVARPSGFSSVSPATSLLSSKSVPRNELKHWLLDLQLAVSQMGTYTISSPGSQAFGLGLELHHQLSWVSHLLTADLETSQHP
uniref:Uncharacterized protein LOC123616465 n=1 Tax=Camelus bactrianus TaxID=9837 RepID=A0A9W3G3F0_CAMBA|nr:uncharacterized protein LOC123616465 [Camelus bactrianus]